MAKKRVNPDSAVSSIRFTPKELQLIRAAEARDGVRLSDIVHAALAQYFVRDPRAVIQFAAPMPSTFVFYGCRPPSVHTSVVNGLTAPIGPCPDTMTSCNNS